MYTLPRQAPIRLDAAGLTKTLRGHVAQPLRYPCRPGMRITHLIPDKETLISPDFYRRENVLVQVIEDDEHNQ